MEKVICKPENRKPARLRLGILSFIVKIILFTTCKTLQSDNLNCD